MTINLGPISNNIHSPAKKRTFLHKSSSLGAGVFGDGLRSLGYGVLGKFSWQQQSHGSLDLPRGNGGPLVVVSELGGLGCDSLEDVIDEGVHNAHGFGRDTGVGMDLLKNFVDVDGVGFLPLLALGSLLTSSLLGLGSIASISLASLLDRLTNTLGWHFVVNCRLI